IKGSLASKLWSMSGGVADSNILSLVKNLSGYIVTFDLILSTFVNPNSLFIYSVQLDPLIFLVYFLLYFSISFLIIFSFYIFFFSDFLMSILLCLCISFSILSLSFIHFSFINCLNLLSLSS